MSDMNQRFTAAVFDFDGVLVDSAEAYRQALSEAVSPVAREDWPKLYGMTTTEAVVFASGGTLPIMKAESIAANIDRRVGTLLAQGPPQRDGALATIRDLKRAGLELAVASSASRLALDVTLAALDWQPHFRAIIGREDVARSKPHPDPYVRAVRELGVAPRQAFAIEDTDIGVHSARGAGLFAVALGGTQTRDELRGADLYFDTFHDLRESKWFRTISAAA